MLMTYTNKKGVQTWLKLIHLWPNFSAEQETQMVLTVMMDVAAEKLTTSTLIRYQLTQTTITTTSIVSTQSNWNKTFPLKSMLVFGQKQLVETNYLKKLNLKFVGQSKLIFMVTKK